MIDLEGCELTKVIIVPK